MRRQVARLLAQAEDDAAWSAQLGAVYRQADVAALLGKSKQSVSSDRGLLRLELRSGEIGYPVFQFDGDRQLRGVREVVGELGPTVATRWTIASWLTTNHPELDERSPLEALRDGDNEVVVTLARRAAAALSP